MNSFTNIQEILTILDVAKSCIKMQYSLSFTTSGERRARDAALRLIDMASAKVMLCTIPTPTPRGVVVDANAGGREMSGTPDRE